MGGVAGLLGPLRVRVLRGLCVVGGWGVFGLLCRCRGCFGVVGGFVWWWGRPAGGVLGGLGVWGCVLVWFSGAGCGGCLGGGRWRGWWLVGWGEGGVGEGCGRFAGCWGWVWAGWGGFSLGLLDVVVMIGGLAVFGGWCGRGVMVGVLWGVGGFVFVGFFWIGLTGGWSVFVCVLEFRAGWLVVCLWGVWFVWVVVWWVSGWGGGLVCVAVLFGYSSFGFGVLCFMVRGRSIVFAFRVFVSRGGFTCEVVCGCVFFLLAGELFLLCCFLVGMMGVCGCLDVFV